MVNTTAICLLLIVFFGLLIIRVPISFSLAISTFVTAIYLKIPSMVVVQQMVKGINSFSLVAIPFFIVAGEIMGEGGISKRLIDFSNVLVGRMRGGLAMVNVLASMFFGGISGSSVADTSSIGSIMIPMMEKQGYDKDYAVDVTITGSTQGILIPPSHNMIIYSLAAGGISVGNMFLGGVIPGILLGVMLMVLSYIIAVKRNYPRGEKVPFKEAVKIIKDGLLGLFTAVIIIVGVSTGVFTATESAAIATVYAFIITFFVYKDIKISRMIPILKNSLRTLSMVLALIATSSAFAWMMAYLKIPFLVTNALISISNNKYVILLIVNIVLLILGMIMDMAPLILICTPILLPVVTKVGMDPIQFGIVLMLNLGIGLLTPPVGSTLFVGCSIAKIPMEKVAKSLMPFYAMMFIVLMILTYVPQVTLFLPRLIGK
ncbi:TRAP transporter, DctM subunit [Caloramator quimbayensis]|uniref:TRAP transporter, DctM subunit n=1 Tax=Caloramator quimbayensis TaxID=1147123 RepID=A0A1T4XWX2_9CLOT|nr:TRAP transporter large permease [Caloramator quimbayensis]SKA94079.1 TRAP transporter, DctM subunit [Caloramator quimbayensis]